MDNELAPSFVYLPPSGAAMRGLGENFQTDLYTGSGSYSIPIDLPPAQNGFKPDLALQYSTGAGNGPFGHGWDISLMAIRRSTRRGFPTYDDRLDGFILTDDLVPVGGGRYRPRADLLGWRIIREGTHWTVTTKDGTRHILGRSPQSRIEHPSIIRPFAWQIEESQTPTGQGAIYTYRHDGGAPVIDTISYGPFRIVFEYEPRPDIFTSNRGGFPLVQRLRCREIRVESQRAASGWLKRYSFDYGGDPRASFLTRVSLSAGSGAEALSMPDARFAYGTWAPGTQELLEVRGAGELPSAGDVNVDMIDLDGSGRPGLLRGDTSGWTYWPNLGEGRFGLARILSGIPTYLSAGDPRVRFLDIEGNGTVDLLWGRQGAAGYYPNAAGGKWEGFVAYDRDLPFDPADPTLRLYDANGDGCVDVIVSTPDSLVIHRNLGRDGWSDTAIRVPRQNDPALFPDVSLADPHILMADMSGDGLSDIVSLASGRIGYWPLLSLGRWGRRVDMASAPIITGFKPERARLIDLTGDGFADLVYLGIDEVQLWLNEGGRSWRGPFQFAAPGLAPERAVVVDLLGEGRPGVFWSLPRAGQPGHFEQRFLRIGPEPAYRLLEEIRGELGHTTRIGYGTSATHRDRDERSGRIWRGTLPGALPVVDSLESIDGPAGIRSLVEMQYHDGHFDGIERSFNGFGAVDQRVAGDASAPAVATTTQFHAGVDLRLSEAERRALAPDDRLAARALRGTALATTRSEKTESGGWRISSRTESRSLTRIEARVGGERVIVAWSQQSITDEIGSEAEAIRRTTVRHGAPTADGNPSWTEYEAGELNASGSYVRSGLKRQIFDYAVPVAGAEPGMTGLLRQISLADEHGAILACTRTYYDGADFEGLAAGFVERGVVKRIEELVWPGSDAPLDAARLRELGYHWLEGAGVAAEGWYRNKSRTANAPSGLVVAARDALGNESRIGYDGWSMDPVESIDAEGLVTRARFDHEVEAIASLLNPSGLEEGRRYDALGRTREVWRTSDDGSLALVSTIEHDKGDWGQAGGSQPPSITTSIAWHADASKALEEGRATGEATIVRRFYSASGLDLESVSSGPLREDGSRAAVHSGLRRYNCHGKVAEEGAPRFADHMNALGPIGAAAYTRRYDGEGREIVVSFPAGKRTQQFEPLATFISDANRIADGTGAGTVRRFDALGRMRGVNERIDAMSEANHGFEYDALDTLAAVSTDGQQVLCYDHDCLGRRVAARHRDIGEYRYQYDAVGNLVRTDHPAGGHTIFAYDRISRMVSASSFDADGALEEVQHYHYDRSGDGRYVAPGRLCTIQDAAGTTELRHMPDGKLSEKKRTTPEGRTLVFRYSYDFRGNLVALTYPNGFCARFVHGAEGEVVAIEGIAKRLGYDARGRPTLIAYENGAESRFRYDASERLAEIETSGPQGAICRFVQTYDPVGNPTEISSHVGTAEERRRLEYDDLGRLIASHWLDGSTLSSHRFSYDRSGNILSNDEHGVRRFLYDDAARPGLLTGIEWADGRTEKLRRYDAAGRMIASESLEVLAWNASERLVSVRRRDGLLANMRYDARGQRARITQFAGDGSRLMSREILDDLYEECSDEQVVHIRGVGGIVATIRFADGAQEQQIWHHDPQGNLRAATDASGGLASSFSYTSFGAERSTLAVDGAFSGKISDGEIGMIQMGARYYEPLTGRFVSGDLMIVERPERALPDPSLFNLYAYAVNSPYRYRDPKGRFVWAIVIVGAIIGAAIGYQAAKENGKDPLTGALIGAVIGGLAGMGGWSVLGSGLTGAALSAGTAMASGGSSADIWAGAAMGFAFGALGGAVSGWMPVVGGDSVGAYAANAAIEIGTDALIFGLQSGTTAAFKGKSFEDGFKSGVMMGAAMSAARIAVVGARYDPASIKQDFHAETEKAFKAQNSHDNSYLAGRVAKAGVPASSSVTYRTGGLVHYISGGRSFAFSGTVHTSSDTMAELRGGSVNTIAHELRHIVQQREAGLGIVEFLAVWGWQQLTYDNQYERGNKTLEPYYE